MTAVLLYVDSVSRLDLQLPWALRIAAKRGDELHVFLRSESKVDQEVKRLDLRAEDGSAKELAAQLDLWVPGWIPAKEQTDEDGDASADAPTDAAPTFTARAYVLPDKSCMPELLSRLREVKPALFIGTQLQLEREEADSSERRRRLMRHVPCEVVLLRAGRDVPENDDVLVPAARGPHCTAALKLARDLTPEDRQFATLLVEPPIGREAGQVGARILSRIVQRALDEDASRARRAVRVHEQVHVGILEECEERRPGLVMMGVSKRGAIGQRLRGTVAQRLLKANERHAVAFVRAAVPLQSRARRWLESYLQRTVPQLERDARIDLFERVQSNSAWDFDFLALMGLATLIAAAGLIENSAAVIIGAMLVAPLMTPLLGMGLALVQGNPQLLRMASRTVTLGFLLALAIGFLAGIATFRFVTPTPEMVARDWPQLLDLTIAFAAGLAGAYTSSRPSLIAALPGVAIAAALVPPIATAGLALSLGDFDLAGGAVLLFLINAVAIVLATTFALWAVGIRDVKEGSAGTRRVGAAFIATVTVLGLYLAIARPQYLAPNEVSSADAAALAERLDGDQRLVDASFDLASEPRILVIEVGGPNRPSTGTIASLRQAAGEAFGEDVPVRILHRWEVGPAGR